MKKQLFSLLAALPLVGQAEEPMSIQLLGLNEHVRLVEGEKIAPENTCGVLKLRGWRGERVSAQFVGHIQNAAQYEWGLSVEASCELASANIPVKI